jgi:hypothetical protein
MGTTSEVRSEASGVPVTDEAQDAAQRYFDAWNSRSGVVVADTLTEDGTYSDPATPGPLSGPALAGYVDGLVTIFPDLSFDLVSESWLTENTLFAEWVMRGTNTGPLPGGAPPLGRTVALPGNDVLVVRGDRVVSVRGTFDLVTMYEQLGLKVTPYPAEPIGPFSFGGGSMVHSGSTAVPQAFGITALHMRDGEEQAEVTQRARAIMAELLGAPGFIAAMGVTYGDRAFTISAWDSPDGPAAVNSSPGHRDAVRAMFQDNLALGGLLATYTLRGAREMTRCRNDHFLEVKDGLHACPVCEEPVERLDGPAW